MNELQQTVDALAKAYTIDSDIDTLNIIRDLRGKRPKIAFFCETASPAFMKDIYNYFNMRYPTRLFVGSNMKHLESVYNWCDIAWFEWCTEQVVYASKLPKTCKSFCRLHRYEAFSKWPKEVKWENIDYLINIGNAYVMDILRRTVPDLDKRTTTATLFNGVDTNKFVFQEKARGKNIGCIGFSRIIKNPMFLLQCFHKLHSIDPEYKLFLAGNFHYEPTLEQYMCYMIQELGLIDSIVFDGHQTNIVKWLADKHFVVSASLVEGHPVNILESMACGVKPIIHTWPGARDLFPEELLFRTVDEFCDKITEQTYEPERYRKFILDNFSLSQQLRLVNEMFCHVEREITNVR